MKTQLFSRGFIYFQLQGLDEEINYFKESTNNNKLELLEKLASLRDQGIVTEEEFLLKKKQILDL